MSLLRKLQMLVIGKKKMAVKRSTKLKLYSMRRIEDKTLFKIEKREDFFRNFRMLLKNLNFKEVDYWHYDPAKQIEGQISHLVNFCDEFNNKSYDIDIVFTQDRVLVILRSTSANRMKFVEELMKFCEWDNPGPVLRRS